LSLHKGGGRRTKGDNDVGRALGKKSVQIAGELSFGVLVSITGRNYREVLNIQWPRRLSVKLLSKRLGIFTPRLEILPVRMKNDDLLGFSSEGAC